MRTKSANLPAPRSEFDLPRHRLQALHVLGTNHPTYMLSRRRILVTAGPTWVPVDRVRVITTTFTGETGLVLARHLRSLGAEVTLWYGPGRCLPSEADRKNLKIIDFKTYGDLATLAKEAELSGFDAIVHSAAVADYQPVPAEGKIPSGLGELTITLRPTEKLVDILRARAPRAILVKFKLETGITTERLLEVAEKSRAFSRAEFIVANLREGMSETGHTAHLLDDSGQRWDVADKAGLRQILGERLCARLSRT